MSKKIKTNNETALKKEAVFSTGNYFAKVGFDFSRSKDVSDLGAVI